VASQPNPSAAQSALRAALVARAVELGIDPESVWCPSPQSVAAWKPDGSLLRIDFAESPARELCR
jgi:hypothetical protein